MHETRRIGSRAPAVVARAIAMLDLVVLSLDLLTLDPDRTMDTEVDLTVLGGRVVYER